MSSKINAISTGVGGLATSADASGILEIQTNDTTAITVDGSQNVAFANTATATAFVGDGSGLTNLPIPPAGVTSLNGETGAIVNTDVYAIGSYINGRPRNNLNYPQGTVLSGASLSYAPTGAGYYAYFRPDGSNSTNIDFQSGNVGVGTWRSLGFCAPHVSNSANYIATTTLWVRIS